MTTRLLERFQRISPAIFLYLVGAALVGFALDGGVYAVLLNLYLVRMGYGPELIGMINSSGQLTFALFSLPAGALGSRWGSRRALLLGMSMMMIGTLIAPFADTLPQSWWIPWLVVNSIVIYMGMALFFVNTSPFVMEAVEAQRRAQVFSIQTGMMSLASFAGSLLSGLLPPVFASMLGTDLSQPAPYRYALLIAGVALIPALMAIYSSRPALVPHEEPAVSPQAGADVKRMSPILGLILVIALVRLLQVAGIASTNTFYNVYLDSQLHVPIAQIGLIVATGRLLGVPSALTSSTLAARFGAKNVVIGSSLLTALAILPMAFIEHWLAAAFTFVCVVSLSWIRYAISQIFFLELVPPSRRAIVAGVTEMAAGLTFTGMTFGGGFIITLFGYRTLFLTGATMTLLSVIIFWLYFRDRGSGVRGQPHSHSQSG